MPERVAAAVHGGEQMSQIVDRGVELAREKGVELLIVHVVDPSFLGSLRGSAHMPDSTIEGLANIGRRHIKGELERVQDQGVPVKTLLRKGELFEELSGLIEEHEVSTLVVGAHKHHFLSTHDEYDWDEVTEETGVEVVVVPA